MTYLSVSPIDHRLFLESAYSELAADNPLEHVLDLLCR